MNETHKDLRSNRAPTPVSIKPRQGFLKKRRHQNVETQTHVIYHQAPPIIFIKRDWKRKRAEPKRRKKFQSGITAHHSK